MQELLPIKLLTQPTWLSIQSKMPSFSKRCPLKSIMQVSQAEFIGCLTYRAVVSSAWIWFL
jgi:hypothetical protein